MKIENQIYEFDINIFDKNEYDLDISGNDDFDLTDDKLAELGLAEFDYIEQDLDKLSIEAKANGSGNKSNLKEDSSLHFGKISETKQNGISAVANELTERAEEFADRTENFTERAEEFSEEADELTFEDEKKHVREFHSKKAGKKRFLYHFLSGTGGLGVALICLAGFVWMVFHVHPGFNTQLANANLTKTNLADVILGSLRNNRTDILNEYLAEEETIQKVYQIPVGSTKALEPNPNAFGSVAYTEADKMLEVIEQARSYGLLEEQDVIFDPNVEFFKRGEIEYYLDETILVICWKEFIDGRIVNMMEVKVQDASQFRRKLTGDTYGSGIEMFATQLAAETNAVAATSADYYAFRTPGIVCYDGKLYRYGDSGYGITRLYNCLDTLFIDANGDFLFFDRNTVMSREEMESYIEDNGISFSLSFGPILVRDGVAIENETYAIGQIDEPYSRAGIGQVDQLHYLFMIVSNSGREHPRATTNEFAQMMAGKGVMQGYNLDGGQTAEYIFNDHLASLVDFGNERTVSDIIYFGTALPKEDWE